MEYLLKYYLFLNHTGNVSAITVVLKVCFPDLWWFSRLFLGWGWGGHPPGQNCFPNNSKALFAVLTFAKSVVGKIAGVLL